MGTHSCGGGGVERGCVTELALFGEYSRTLIWFMRPLRVFEKTRPIARR